MVSSNLRDESWAETCRKEPPFLSSSWPITPGQTHSWVMEDCKLRLSVEIVLLTDRKAWIRSALTEARGFPLTSTVNVSSFSEVIRLPNQDFFVSSGEDSGVRPTSSEDAATIFNIWDSEYTLITVTSKLFKLDSIVLFTSMNFICYINKKCILSKT